MAHSPGNNQLFEFWRSKKRVNNAVHQLLRRDRIPGEPEPNPERRCFLETAFEGAGEESKLVANRVPESRKILYSKYLDIIEEAARSGRLRAWVGGGNRRGK